MLDATPLLKLYCRYRLGRLARRDAAAVQQRQLMRLVKQARGTRFGREHRFERIDTISDFRVRVPLRQFEEFWETYWRDTFPEVVDQTWPGKIPHYARSSGTSSGTSKNIPVTAEILAGNRQGVLDMLCAHVRAMPSSRVLGGRNFMLGGTIEVEQLAPGVTAGDMSGLSAFDTPVWARPFTFPSGELAQISDWQEKLDVLGPLSRQADIRTIGGTASWLLLFLQTAMEPSHRTVRDLYPKLELIVYGGVNFEPYRAQYEKLLGDDEVDLREVYPASEGFIAYADRGVGEGMRLLCDAGIFYEFVPMDAFGADRPPRHWIGDAQKEVEYAVIVTTPAGLWGYVLGDTVRFVDLDPPRLMVTGRTSNTLSAFGEHLTEAEIDKAVADAARRIGLDVAEFSVSPVFPSESERRGRHRFIVEFVEPVSAPERVRHFVQALDERLSELNDDYRVHRAGDVQMAPPEILVAAPGAFVDWMRQRGKLGGQNKVPRVIHDAAFFGELEAHVRSFAGGNGSSGDVP